MPGTTDAILNHLRSLGCFVSLHRLQFSLNGKIPACTEMHAVKVAANPPEQFIAKVIDTGEEAEYRCACELAAMVGIELEDG